MIYLQSVYSRRDPISIGLQNTFQPIFEMSDAMAATLRRLDLNERHARAPRPLPARRRREVAVALA